MTQNVSRVSGQRSGSSEEESIASPSGRNGASKRRIIDLSFEVYQGMMVYPGVAKPVIVEMENHQQMARSMGTDVLGVTHLPNHCMIVTGDHVGTHLDSWGHVNPKAPRAEGIPLDYCYGDGVVLDLTAKGPGEEIWPDDLQRALRSIDYTLKPLDIVLLRTDAAKFRDERRYLTDHPGMTREATIWLLDQGIKMMGIDAPGFDLPVPNMFERKKFWESHLVMLEREYYHLENMGNLHEIPAPYHSFTVSVLPVKWRGASAAAVRAVAIVEG
jgi:kynurenine formamidase